MNTQNMNEATATSEQVDAVITKIENALDGTERGLGIISLLSLALVIQSPTITPDELAFAVRETSRFICLLLDGTGEGTEPRVVN